MPAYPFLYGTTTDHIFNGETRWISLFSGSTELTSRVSINRWMNIEDDEFGVRRVNVHGISVPVAQNCRADRWALFLSQSSTSSLYEGELWSGSRISRHFDIDAGDFFYIEPQGLQVAYFEDGRGLGSPYNDAYERTFFRLLPPGKAFEYRSGSVLQRFVSGLTRELSRVEKSAKRILDEMFPDTAQEMLGEMETWAGLPEPGSTASSVAERQEALIEKLTRKRTPTSGTLISIAEELGYTGSNARNAGKALGIMTCNSSCTSSLWTENYYNVAFLETSGSLGGTSDQNLEEQISVLTPPFGSIIIIHGANPYT